MVKQTQAPNALGRIVAGMAARSAFVVLAPGAVAFSLAALALASLLRLPSYFVRVPLWLGVMVVALLAGGWCGLGACATYQVSGGNPWAAGGVAGYFLISTCYTELASFVWWPACRDNRFSTENIYIVYLAMETVLIYRPKEKAAFMCVYECWPPALWRNGTLSVPVGKYHPVAGTAMNRCLYQQVMPELLYPVETYVDMRTCKAVDPAIQPTQLDAI